MKLLQKQRRYRGSLHFDIFVNQDDDLKARSIARNEVERISRSLDNMSMHRLGLEGTAVSLGNWYSGGLATLDELALNPELI